jgi:hypothetical protein
MWVPWSICTLPSSSPYLWNEAKVTTTRGRHTRLPAYVPIYTISSDILLLIQGREKGARSMVSPSSLPFLLLFPILSLSPHSHHYRFIHYTLFLAFCRCLAFHAPTDQRGQIIVDHSNCLLRIQRRARCEGERGERQRASWIVVPNGWKGERKEAFVRPTYAD